MSVYNVCTVKTFSPYIHIADAIGIDAATEDIRQKFKMIGISALVTEKSKNCAGRSFHVEFLEEGDQPEIKVCIHQNILVHSHYFQNYSSHSGIYLTTVCM